MAKVASGAERRRLPKTNLMHSKAVRKPLVAIILLYSEEQVLQ